MNTQKSNTETLINLVEELDLVKDHPRMLVLVAHGFLELLINMMIEKNINNHKKIISDNRSYSHSTKLLILNEMGVISDKQYSVYDWFRKLRNKAAHRPIFHVNKSGCQYGTGIF